MRVFDSLFPLKFISQDGTREPLLVYRYRAVTSYLFKLTQQPLPQLCGSPQLGLSHTQVAQHRGIQDLSSSLGMSSNWGHETKDAL